MAEEGSAVVLVPFTGMLRVALMPLRVDHGKEGNGTYSASFCFCFFVLIIFSLFRGT